MRRLLFALALSLAVQPAMAAGGIRLTPHGLGDLRIGMKERDAARRFHLKIARDDGVSSYDCREDSWPGHPGVWLMAERGVITRISVEAPSRLRTDRGFGVGSQEADIRRAYGPSLKVETAAYEEEPAHDLTFWAGGRKDGRRGVRYGTDAQGVVQWFAVGSPSISYIEGCL